MTNRRNNEPTDSRIVVTPCIRGGKYTGVYLRGRIPGGNCGGVFHHRVLLVGKSGGNCESVIHYQVLPIGNRVAES